MRTVALFVATKRKDIENQQATATLAQDTRASKAEEILHIDEQQRIFLLQSTILHLLDLRKTDASIVAVASPPASAGAGQAIVLSSAMRPRFKHSTAGSKLSLKACRSRILKLRCSLLCAEVSFCTYIAIPIDHAKTPNPSSIAAL